MRYQKNKEEKTKMNKKLYLRKILSFLLSVVMIVCVVPASNIGIIASIQELVTVGAEPQLTSTVIGYHAHGSTSDLCTSSNSNDGLTDTSSKALYGTLDGNGIISVVKDGGTIVETGRGFVSVDYTFPVTMTPVLITAVVGEKDYREGSTVVNEAKNGNGLQRGTFILGDKEIIATFAGEYIFNNITVFTRNKTGGAVMSVADGGKLVIGEGTVITNMSESSNHTATESPTLNVDEGGTAYLHAIGFERYTGSGTIVLDRTLVATGQVAADTFAGFAGDIVYADGASVFTPVSEGETNIQRLYSVTLEDGAIYSVSTKNSDTYGKGALTSEDFGNSDNAVVKPMDYAADLSQMWRAHRNDDGTYTFENMSGRMHLAVITTDGDENENTLSVCLNGTNDASKRWNIYSTDSTIGSCVLVNTSSMLAATVISDEDGSVYVQQGAYSAADTQQWHFKKLSDGDGEYPYVLALSGDYIGSSSCPEILYHNGVYYNYNMTGPITLKTSTDLINWTLHADRYALSERPSWLSSVSGGTSIWAPGAYKIGNKYYLYYCTSSSGSQNSAIGVAVTDDPSKNDWTDKGMVIRSYTGDQYNCIDPNIFIDDDGTVFLIFGSYWEGIFMRKIDPETGMLDESDTTAYHIAQGNHDMEAPYLIKHGNYYYLFTARGGLSKGTYYWAVGRSESVYGPYVDKDGTALLSGSGGTRLTEWKDGIEGAAHAQYFEDAEGNAYMVSESWPYRANEELGITESGKIQLHISKIVWTADGWPVTALDPDVLTALGE